MSIKYHDALNFLYDTAREWPYPVPEVFGIISQIMVARLPIFGIRLETTVAKSISEEGRVTDTEACFIFHTYAPGSPSAPSDSYPVISARYYVTDTPRCDLSIRRLTPACGDPIEALTAAGFDVGMFD